MKYVHPILSMVRAAREEVSFSTSQSHTDIPFAWAGKFEDNILCELCETFAAEYPQYTLLPREGTSAQMLEEILKEEIEFAYLLIPENIDVSKFHSQSLQCSTLSVAVAKTTLPPLFILWIQCTLSIIPFPFEDPPLPVPLTFVILLPRSTFL